jgi:addiction module RelB/DinJ family antitoxin
MSCQLQVRLDDDVRQSFENICNESGLSMSSVVNLFANAVVRERETPFESNCCQPPVRIFGIGTALTRKFSPKSRN